MLRAVVAVLLLIVAGSALAQSQNPFGKRSSEAPAAPAPERRVEAPGFFDRAYEQVRIWQRQTIDGLSREMREYKETGALQPVIAILLISFLYGVFHAVGPGHGKFVTSTYFAATRARYVQGLTMTAMISVIQAASAIAIVGILAIALSVGRNQIDTSMAYIEATSNALIVLLGLYIAYGGLVGRGCSHEVDHHARDHVHADHHHRPAPAPTAGFWSMTAAAFSAGIRPCTGAILVLLFTLSHGIFGIGVLSAFVMAFGVFLVLAAIGFGVIFARRSIGSVGAQRPAIANFAHRAAGIIGGIVIVVFGGRFLIESLKGLGVTL